MESRLRLSQPKTADTGMSQRLMRYIFLEFTDFISRIVLYIEQYQTMTIVQRSYHASSPAFSFNSVCSFTPRKVPVLSSSLVPPF
jgi:hypothetical protein